MKPNTISVIHLIPYDGIGGVETAARSLGDGIYGDISFTKLYLADKSGQATASRYASENDPRSYWDILRKLLSTKSDVVVASLWRSCLVLIALKLLRPCTSVVTFLHLPKDVHWLDWLFNRLAMVVSNEIWADSQTTLLARVPRIFRHRARVVSFLVHPLQEPTDRVAQPAFIFWGRLHPQKALARALRIFARVSAIVPNAIFHIIGPDGGERIMLEREVTHLGLESCVTFHGAMNQEAIFSLARQCAFYLQTSESEGMAMSVVEAMQLGLVPIVTPVGEIAQYCRHGRNALLVEHDELVVTEVLAVLENQLRYQGLSEQAVQTWSDKPFYADSFIQACQSLLFAERRGNN